MSETKLRKKFATYNNQPSRTYKEFKNECDINRIMTQFKKTGQLPPVRVGQYLDNTKITSDYQEAHKLINEVNQAFADLSAINRARFNNNPQQFLEFMSQEKNLPEAIELGILEETPAIQKKRFEYEQSLKKLNESNPKPNDPPKP